MEILHIVLVSVAMVLAILGLFVQLFAPFNLWANIFAKSWQYHLMMFVFWVINTISAMLNIYNARDVYFNVFMVMFGLLAAIFYYYQAITRAKPDLDKQLSEYHARQKLKNDHRPISITREGEFIYEDEDFTDEEDHYFQNR